MYTSPTYSGWHSPNFPLDLCFLFAQRKEDLDHTVNVHLCFTIQMTVLTFLHADVPPLPNSKMIMAASAVFSSAGEKGLITVCEAIRVVKS